MINSFISELILKELGHEPTKSQKDLAKDLAEFIVSENNQAFLIIGYAGTGKTTFISALVKVMDSMKISTVLLAPTGRAAKVLTQYTGKQASTIHKRIYRKKSALDWNGRFSLDRNLNKNSIFIVDEASMITNAIPDHSIFGSGDLLSDLIEYVGSGNNCKLILSGDTAQLPPVGSSLSPALIKEELEYYNLEVKSSELTDVVRQSIYSDILVNATHLRNLLSRGDFSGFWNINLKKHSDCFDQ